MYSAGRLVTPRLFAAGPQESSLGAIDGWVDHKISLGEVGLRFRGASP
jgi:hypothetical protein